MVKREYNHQDVIATDVSYIPIKSSYTNHAYLSIAINHKTKYIESWNISESNDNLLVLEHFKTMDLKGKIVHSDHGSQYLSHDFVNLIKNAGANLSMSRVGNSLDNREAECFFSNIKSECLNHIKTSQLNITEVAKHVSEYIEWYNYKRIQSKLK